jgi:hypothetical protein
MFYANVYECKGHPTRVNLEPSMTTIRRATTVVNPSNIKSKYELAYHGDPTQKYIYRLLDKSEKNERFPIWHPNNLVSTENSEREVIYRKAPNDLNICTNQLPDIHIENTYYC